MRGRESEKGGKQEREEGGKIMFLHVQQGHRSVYSVGNPPREPGTEQSFGLSRLQASPRQLYGGEKLLWGDANVLYNPDHDVKNRTKGAIFVTNYRLIFTPEEVVTQQSPLIMYAAFDHDTCSGIREHPKLVLHYVAYGR